ncbi:sensor histidine kinase [Acetonema longum]|uniref:histidine kinase n=1 Tax=Acetonema longum DSM 6540 TaxID=1009370 RepID=F7NLT5_9FIRM|nr:ATP-binding protein [Acetonema longum]EGO63026.1 integral membrane sensor signal transduction histidine kinase [Acetonema longum DSM 6540]
MIGIFRRRWNLFGKVLWRLTALNTGVLLLVFIVYNVLLYMVISNQLYANVDNGMRSLVTSVSQEIRRRAEAVGYRTEAVTHEKTFRFMLPPLPPPHDPRILLLFFNAEGDLAAPYPNVSLNAAEVAKLAAEAISGSPQSQIYEGHYYRCFKMSYDGELLPFIAVGQRLVQIKDIIAVANVEPELRLLHTFLLVSTAGTMLVFLIIVAAGYFLAEKALIPINASWEKQEQFVADASHEMRTPLAVIKSQAELLLHSPDRTIEEESARIASVIKETTRLGNLVAKLLLLARSDSNQIEIEYQPIQLQELVATVVTQFQPIAGLKNIALSLPAGDWVEIMGDREKIAQLLVILLDNAVKYTPEGGSVTVRVNKRHNAAEMIVQDTGMGISAGDLPCIFDRFYRADKSRSGKERGNGLGLAIAKWIVEKHAGSISAESSLGTGTTMVVTLPRKRNFFP